MTLPRFDYRAPATVEEAVALLAEHGEDALPIAGGTAVVIMLRQGFLRPRVLVSLENLAGIGAIESDGEHRIGALATHREIARSAALRADAALLSEACGRVGSPAIRNMGTIGGNLCHGDAASDPAPALLALDARAVLSGPEGERSVKLAAFFKDIFDTDVGAGEILTAVRVPRTPPGARSRFVKYTCLSAEAMALVSVAALAVPGPERSCAEIRIGLGGVGRTPLRALRAEEVLRGQSATPARIAEAAEVAAADTDPPTDGQGSAAYRRDMTRVWVRRTLEDLFR